MNCKTTYLALHITISTTLKNKWCFHHSSKLSGEKNRVKKKPNLSEQKKTGEKNVRKKEKHPIKKGAKKPDGKNQICLKKNKICQIKKGVKKRKRKTNPTPSTR